MNQTVSASFLLLFFRSIGETFGTSLFRSHDSRKLADGAEVPLVPDLMEDWESIPDYPLDVGEAQGAMVGFDLILFGGFLPRFEDGAKETYMLNLKDHYDGLNVGWVRMDDCPVHPYWTHAAHAVKGNQLFFCGGYIYVDENDEFYAAPERNECYIFDKTASSGNQWQPMPFLPEGRAGGGMVYVESMDILVFALGATRPNGHYSVVDEPTVWMFDLSNPSATWVQLADAPYTGNHVAAVDAKDCAGNNHFYWLGGQDRYNETGGNIDLMYEYKPETDTWEQRANLPHGTGHSTSSTIAYGCGFIIVGGAVDGRNLEGYSKTRDIYYYDIDNDQWSDLGDYARKIKTPVCGIYSDKLYCSTGYVVDGWRSTIAFPDIPTIAPTAPSSAPSPTPDLSEVPSSAPSPTAPILSSEIPSIAPLPTPLWDDVSVRTIYKSGNFCPDANVNVKVQVAGEDVEGVPVTLKNDTLGIDLVELTNRHGRVKFTINIPDPRPAGLYWVESCAYDAGGTAYCDYEEVEVLCLAEQPSIAPTPTPAPLWDDVRVRTVYRNGDFCPNANVWVRVELDGVNAPGVRVTLKSDELGIDMEEKTNDGGRAKFAITVQDPDPDKQTVYLIEGCAYDAGGTAYCDTREFEMTCS